MEGGLGDTCRPAYFDFYSSGCSLVFPSIILAFSPVRVGGAGEKRERPEKKLKQASRKVFLGVPPRWGDLFRASNDFFL